MSAPITAVPKLSIRRPQSVCSVIHDVSISISALTTSVNRPSVRMYSGIDRSATIGLTMALTMPNTSAMSRITPILPAVVCPPMISRPGRISDASQMATPLTRTRTTNPMT